jgi:photosystem II stability/assembly factor-like uncharacterized protein
VTWTPQIAPTRAHLYAVSFLDKNTGLVAGDRGTLLKTTDGGKGWREVVRAGTQPLTAVVFINKTRAIAVGYGARVLLSEDAGDTWEPTDAGIRDDLLTVYFADEQNGWIAGDNGVVLSTGNGGKLWLPSSIRTNPRLVTIYFGDNNTGWAAGSDGLVVRSDDGGIGWRRLTNGGRDDLGDLFFLDGSRGWAGRRARKDFVDDGWWEGLDYAIVRHARATERGDLHRSIKWVGRRGSRHDSAFKNRRTALGETASRIVGRSHRHFFSVRESRMGGGRARRGHSHQ